jgi:Cys-tRNA(Pro)/Cys-tRNA(Cys) deacylase
MQQKTHDTSFRASKSDWTLYNVKPAEKTSVQKTVVQKTNAARLLDRMGIRYELRQYEADPNDLAAETVAAKIGLPPEQVFKTLVARGDRSKDRNGIVMAVIPGDQELNLKALAAAAGERKIQLVPVKELQALTGYIRGGVTALAAKRDFPVYMDETIELFDVVSISAGVRGLQILIAPADYLRATKGRLAALGQPKAG